MNYLVFNLKRREKKIEERNFICLLKDLDLLKNRVKEDIGDLGVIFLNFNI